jgi:hypothetical protein
MKIIIFSLSPEKINKSFLRTQKMQIKNLMLSKTRLNNRYKKKLKLKKKEKDTYCIQIKESQYSGKYS